MSRILSVLLGVLVAVSVSFAAPTPAPSTKVSYDEYRELLRLKVSEVPELKALWSWTGKDKIEGIYLGGGILRGLLLWVNKELAAGDLEKVRKTRPPGIKTLLIQKDADLDIFANDEWAKRIKKWDPYAGWDVLDETFYRQSVANQGATFDRIRINPKVIDDPLDALKAFYEGRLTFRTDSIVFRESHDTKVFGDNWLGLTLRFVRFTQDLKDVVDADPAAKEEIRKLAKSAGDWIPMNGDYELNWPKKNDAKQYMAFRIRKALNKLYKATKGDDVQFLEVLADYGLLALLSEREYNVHAFKTSRLPDLIVKARERRLPLENVARLVRMSCLTIPDCIKMHKDLLADAKTPAEAVLAIRPFRGNPNKDYVTAIADWLVKALPKNELLRQAELSHEERRNLEELYNRVDMSKELKSIALRTATTAADKIAILESVWENPSEHTVKMIQALAKAEMQSIAPAIQSADDLLKFEKMLFKYADALEAKKLALAQTKDPAVFVGMLENPWDPKAPQDVYRKGLREIIDGNLDRFLALNPPGSAIDAYSKLASAEAKVKLQPARIRHLHEVLDESFLKLLAENPAPARVQEYLAKIDPDLATAWGLAARHIPDSATLQRCLEFAREHARDLGKDRKEAVLLAFGPALSRLHTSFAHYNLTRTRWGLGGLSPRESPWTPAAPKALRCEAVF